MFAKEDFKNTKQVLLSHLAMVDVWAIIAQAIVCDIVDKKIRMALMLTFTCLNVVSALIQVFNDKPASGESYNRIEDS